MTTGRTRAIEQPMMQVSSVDEPILGWWRSNGAPPSEDPLELKRAIDAIGEPFYLLRGGKGRYAVGRGGEVEIDTPGRAAGSQETAGRVYPIRAWVPPCRPELLGDRNFCADHGLRYPYIAGAMANGVGSCEIVEAMGRAGMLGFFGAAGLAPARVEAAIDRVQTSLRASDGRTCAYGFNLIHSPQEPGLEAAIADLYLRRGVRLVSASAYLQLTPALVRYRVHGIHRTETGEIVAPNRVIAKVSRIEVARRFFSPPPDVMLREFVDSGEITAEQAEWAAQVPMAQDLTAEADSGGHTDNQPFITLLPTMLALRDEHQQRFGFGQKLRVGAAGGTP